MWINADKEIWTIGHSTHSLEEFIEMLKSFHIQRLVDVRSFPGSRKYPHFNKDSLEISLPQKGIEYEHLKILGGRRKAQPDSKHTVWRHPAFRAYADYMDSDDFEKGMENLEKWALEKRTAYFCSEAVWWRCHRSMISDYLKAKGWKVMHIMNIGKADEHPYTKPACVIDGRLTYE